MNRFLWFLLIGLFVILLSVPAWAAGFTNCRGTTIAPFRINDSRDLGCYAFTDADTTPESGMIVSLAQSVLICLDPDTLTAGVQAANVKIYHCPSQVKAATGANTCEPIEALAGSDLTGLAGTSATQNRCVRGGPGGYYVDVTVDAGAGDTALVSFQGE